MAKRSASQEKNTAASAAPVRETSSGRTNPLRANTQPHTKPLAKSADPSYMKFTTYIRKTTHIGVKTRLVSKEKELSDLVEELLTNWLKDNDAVTI